MDKREIIQRKKGAILLILLCICLTGCNKANQGNNTEKLENITSKTVSPTIKVSQNTSLDNIVSTDMEETKTLPEIEIVDYSESFDGFEGCAVFYNSDDNVYKIYKEELCEKRTSPCSTFKVIATIMALESGTVSSVDTKMGYDETVYSIDAWNNDLTLKDAFRESCVWYFRKVIDQLGQSEVQKNLDCLQYGNSDISEWEGSGINSSAELNGFWLESSLEISPKEQVKVLADIFNGKTDFSKQNIEILKEVMLIQQIGNASVYGKTGTGQNAKTGNRNNGWFVGMFEDSKERYYFAIRLTDESKEVSGPIAKEIALDIIDKYYVKK